MKIEFETYEKITIINLNGSFTRDSAAKLQQTVERLTRQGRKYIILNMESVEYIDSQSIILLLRINRETLFSGGVIKLLRPKKIVQRFLSIGRVLELFDRYETKFEAVRTLTEHIDHVEQELGKAEDPIQTKSRNQRRAILRLLEILIEKGTFSLEEFNGEYARSNQWVLNVFRNQFGTQDDKQQKNVKES